MASVKMQKLGEKGRAGKVELDAAVFEAEIKPHLFHAEVRRQLAARRAGTHATRNRSAVSGGGGKPWRQKGTGRARHGSSRAPQWAGGGAVFGPVPRDYSHKLPKKMRRAALRGALSLRHSEAALIVVDSLEIDEFKTRRVTRMLEQLEVADASVLLVPAAASPHFEVSARNLPRVSVVRAEGLNVYDVLRHEKLVIEEGALEPIARRLGGAGEATAGASAGGARAAGAAEGAA